MKVFILAPNESWICDRFANEWKSNNPKISTNDIEKSDIVWLLGSWCWKNIPYNILRNKKVITTIHHLVPEKFSRDKQFDFLVRDQITDAYHVPSKKTREQIALLTEKPIYDFPFWVNQNLWHEIKNTSSLRKKYNIEDDEFVVGSFQRDTEGHDLKSPKLEKGPDLFCNAIENMFRENKNISVLLAGWRRQYVMSRLDKAKIPYRYFELPDFETLNELYNCLDLYLVTSRYEGGPQSILECAANKTPIISTDVGIAPEILSENSIMKPNHNAFPDIEIANKNVQDLLIPSGFDKFISMFKEINEK